MTAERWARLKELFEQAVELESSERAGFIERQCGMDRELSESLWNLLRQHESASDFLDSPLVSRQRVFAYFTQSGRAFKAGEVVATRFRIINFIGQGGMGEVYEAEDLELGERVALKTLRTAIASDENVMARFKQEIQLGRRVTHPNVSRIFDMFRHVSPDGATLTFLTMELLDGETLAHRIRSGGRFSTGEALPIVRQIVAGLEAAHAAGIIHRDFKSSNVMLTSNPTGGTRAVVTDFGLAGAAQGDSGLPAAGTPAYIAPEQLCNKELTPAVDIYALGVVMFEIVTGCLPFTGQTTIEIAKKRLYEPAPAPRQFAPNLPGRWNTAILACLDQDPLRRPAPVTAVLDRLEGSGVYRRWFIGASTVAALGGTVASLATRPRPIKPEAEKNFKRAEEFAKRRNAEGFQNAIEEYKRAVAIQPDYDHAWAGLAASYAAGANFNFMAPATALKEARNASEQALNLNPRLAKAQGVLGYVISIDVHTWLTAEPYLKRAVETDPKEPSARLWYGAYLGKVGRSQEAIRQLKAGLDQAPSDLVLNQQLAMEYFRAGQLDEFLTQARTLVWLQPFDPASHLALARALEWKGQYEEALRSCDEADKYKSSVSALCFRGSTEAARGNRARASEIAMQVEVYWRTHPFETILLAGLFCQLGMAGKAVAVLNAGYDRNDSSVLTAPASPYLKSLRSDLDFQAFLRRLGLKSL